MSDNKNPKNTKNNQTIEEKLLRLQEIQNLLQEKKVTLSESVSLLKEASRLKAEIELELQQIENKLNIINQNQE